MWWMPAVISHEVADQQRLHCGEEGYEESDNRQRCQRQCRGYNPAGEQKSHGHLGEAYSIKPPGGGGGATDAYTPRPNPCE